MQRPHKLTEDNLNAQIISNIYKMARLDVRPKYWGNTRHIILSGIFSNLGFQKSIRLSSVQCSHIKIYTQPATTVIYITRHKIESNRLVKFIPIFVRSQATTCDNLHSNGRLLNNQSAHSIDIRPCRQICTEN